MAPSSRVAADGTFTVLHAFAGGADDGENPGSGVIADSDGNLYGASTYGGASNEGLLFRLTQDGTFTKLHDFSGNDGKFPYGILMRDTQGNLYGTASAGGIHGGGTAYKFAADGTFSVLHAFGGGTDGSSPLAGVVMDGRRYLYGTTTGGGAHGAGVVFELRANGREKILYAFSGGADGSQPYGALVRDALGNLYGTTFAGGKIGDGTAYKLAAHGTFSTLHSFGEDKGEYLYAGLALDKGGNLYGATVHGGAQDGGVAFRLRPSGRETVIAEFSYGSGPYGSPVVDRYGNIYGATFRGGSDEGAVWKFTP